MLHAADIQRDAAAIIHECGVSHVSRTTQRLAALGSHGRHPQNIERDLYRLLHSTCDLPVELYDCNATIASVDGLSHETVAVPILLPPEVFAAIARQGNNWFNHSMCPSAATARDFWARLSSADYMRHHPVAADPSCWADVVPVVFVRG